MSDQPSSAPMISVLIITAGRPDQLDACLRSLRAQDAPPTFELIVGGVGDPSVAPVVWRHFPEARVGLVSKSHPGAARNPLIERARGDLLLFLDDDVVVEPDLLQQLGRLAAEHPEAAVFGGPNETPAGSTRFEFIQGAVLASLVATGPVRRRYGRHPQSAADERYFTLCNLAVRRPAMMPFSAELVCAEENAVLASMSRSGLRMLYHPKLVAFHVRRPNLASFGRQMMKYGTGRGQLLRRDPGTFRPAYLAPSLLLLYLVLTPLIAWIEPLGLGLWALYGGVVAAGAVRVSRSMPGARASVPAGGMIILLHLAYGLGLMRGLAHKRSWRAPSPPSWQDIERSVEAARA